VSLTGPRGPKTLDDPKLDGGRLQAVLPPLSWNMIRLS
jgi:alpha-N-arabinofuranosidase